MKDEAEYIIYAQVKEQKQVDTNTAREIRLRVDHGYEIGDKISIADKDTNRKLSYCTKGPYENVQIYANGTVRVSKGALTGRFNIRRCTPYTN